MTPEILESQAESQASRQSQKDIRGVSGFDPANNPKQPLINEGSKTPRPDRATDTKHALLRVILTLVLLAVVILCTTSVITGSRHRGFSVGSGPTSESLYRLDQEILAFERQAAEMRRRGADTSSIEYSLQIAERQRAALANQTGGGTVPRQRLNPIVLAIDLLAIFCLFGLWRKKRLPLPNSSDGRRSSGVPISGRSGKIRGIARSVAQRTETHNGMNSQRTVQVCTFKIEILEDERSIFVPVEMKGERSNGILSDGDLIEAPGPWRIGETLQPKQVLNLTTGGQFGLSDGHSRELRILLQVIGFILFGLAFLFVAHNMFR